MQESVSQSESVNVKSLFGAMFAIALLAVLMTFVVRCPCEAIPGTVLSGNTVTAAVSDWAFANDERLCQIEVQGIIPWSVNLNCMADAAGAMYLSCARCDGKYWSSRALVNSDARIRIGSDIYPVRLSRVKNIMLVELCSREELSNPWSPIAFVSRLFSTTWKG